MRKMKKWIINKRIYNIERNAKMTCLGALLDIEIFNKIKEIKEKKGIKNNAEYIKECYRHIKNNVL